MYKIYTNNWCMPPGYIKKILLVMKITTFLLFVGFMQVSAAGLAQKVTLVKNPATLRQLFLEINKQTTYNVIWSADEVNGDIKINAEFKDTPLLEVLDKALESTDLTYSITNKTVLIKPKAPAIFDKIKSSFVAISGNISGMVTDSTGAPLVGATVILTNTKYVTSTDADGKFTLTSVPNGKYHYIVSYVGYKKQEGVIEITGGNFVFGTVILKTDQGKLKEVVISNGYQNIPQERATGSFDFIDNSLLNRSVSTDIISRLNGVTSGLLTSPVANVAGSGISNSTSPAAGSGPGNSLGINIRGLSTIQSNTTPLIVLDNFPYDGDINNINPNDVESISILKDAAAESIWGARAGNGVIVITSKKGNLNQPLKVSFNANFTLSAKPNLFYSPNFLDANDFINVEQQLFANGYYSAMLASNGTLNNAVSPVVDLLNQESNGTISAAQANAQINALRNIDVRNDISRYFYQRQADRQYSLSLSGGSNKTTYFFSAGYDDNDQNLVDNNYQRITLTSRNVFNPVKGLQISTDVNFIQTELHTDPTLNELMSGGGIATGGSGYATIYPYAQLADSKGNPIPIDYGHLTEYVNAAPSLGFLNWQFNPIEELRNGSNTLNSNTTYVRAGAGVSYTIIPGLSLDARYQYEKSLADGTGDANIDSYYTRNLINEFSTVDGTGVVNGHNIPLGDIASYSLQNQVTQNFRAQLNYSKEWAKNAISFIGGFEVSDAQTTGNGFTNYGYDPNTGTILPVDLVDSFPTNPSGSQNIPAGVSYSKDINRFRSYFGNASYTYNGRYTFSVSSRIDQSNLFGVNENQKSNPAWSTGFKWDISKEQFYNIGWLPNLDFRATYGYSGNTNNSFYAYPTAVYSTSGSVFGNYQTAYLTSPGDPDLRWEQDGILNLALDFAFKNNVIYGKFDYYFKNDSYLIGFEPIQPSSGVSNVEGNYSNMTGRGFDLELGSHIINKTFKWNANLLTSYSTNEVTKYLGTTSSNYSIVTGKPVQGLYGLKWAGLDPANGNPRGYLNGQISEDYASLVSQTLVNPGNSFNTNSSWQYIGSAVPTIFGSFRNTFSYKNFSLSANIVYKAGYYFKRSSISYTSLFGSGVGNVDFTKRWQNPGDENATNVPSMPNLSLALDPNRDLFYGESQALFDKGDNIRFQDVNFSYTINKSKVHRLPFESLQLYMYANNLGIIWRANKDKLDPDTPTGIPVPRTLSLGLRGNF